VIAKYGVAERIAIHHRSLVDADENSALPIRHHHVGKFKDVLETMLASGGHKQDEVATRVAGSELRLVCVVAPQLSFDGFDVLLATDSFCAVVEFDDKVERAVVRRDKLERTVRIKYESVCFQLEAILASKMPQVDATTVAGRCYVHDQVSQGNRVVMVPVTDLFEVAASRHCGVGTIEQSVTVAS